MTLAAILVVYFFLGMGSAGGMQEQAAPEPQTATPSGSQEKPAPGTQQTSPQQTSPQQAPAKSAKPAPHHKKRATPKCSAAGGDDAGKAAGQKPCPAAKVVVRNGGSDAPAVKLNGDASGPGSSAGSTEELMAAANENLRQISPRELNESQRESVSQIQEFLAQAKAAVDAGDLERGHNLALKARVLSDELVKP